ncbi:TPM domain-containing protein [Pedobacter immunditicola]|uniref:TPM domain-containing protein n=1 Tax=Pedobacter immunditicola TaxID=3133440 RepID=UPI0030A934DB
MKKPILLFLLVFLTSLGFAQDFPAKPNKLVNDYTGTFSASQTQQLEDKLVAFSDSTSIQIAVAVLKSVGEYDINDYALQLGRQWGVGSQKNTGIMIVVALGDRKIAIQTGYGLEGALPDVYAKRIIENDIKPYFKAGDYYAGIESGTNAIISYTKGEYKNDKPKKVTKDRGAAVPILIIIVIIIIIIMRKGGGGRGGSQVIGSRGVADSLFWGMLLGSMTGRSGGGGFGGGFGSGGGGGGGGFGGFGGGSFGGGGSSGDW